MKEDTKKNELQAEARSIFHKLWTNAVGQEGYEKKEWQEFQNLLYKIGVKL